MKQEIKNIEYINQSGNDEILVKLTGRKEIDLFSHKHNKEQIIYTLSGTLHVKTEKNNYFVPERHIVWIPSDMEHKLSSNNKIISLIIFYIKIENKNEDLQIFNTNPFITENIRFMSQKERLIKKDKDSNMFYFISSFFKLLPDICPASKMIFKTHAEPQDKRLIPVLDYISIHYNENLKIETVASKFGMSGRNLSRLLNISGINFCGYINTQRIMKAIELFSEGEKTIKQIAYDVGFSTPNNFNRVFKSITGMAPTNFYNSRIK